MNQKHNIVILILTLFFGNLLKAQSKNDSIKNYMNLDYNQPVEYTIAGIETEGNSAIDKFIIIIQSNLSINQTIKLPGNEISQAIENLWRQGYYSDIQIYAKKIVKDKIYLVIKVVERPKLLKFAIRGLGKTQKKNLRDELTIKAGLVITENLLNQTTREIQKYFYEKGYYDVKIDFKSEKIDTIPNKEILYIYVDKGQKVKVQDIEIIGNEAIKDSKIKGLLNKKSKFTDFSIVRTKKSGKKSRFRIHIPLKFIEDKYNKNKPSIIEKYQAKGYRDAYIKYDSVIKIKPNRVAIKMAVHEGPLYHFGNINFTGNNKYTSEQLLKILAIKKGDVYNLAYLDERLNFSPNGTDISSLYMDDGYLFFSVTPVETRVYGDTIDIEIRIVERTQAYYDKIIVNGNDKTSDHVILRELRTRPGEKFSRSDIQRSIRELSQLGYFDPQGMNVVPKPNPSNGTVDIEYTVVEKANDQIELSGGWGGRPRQGQVGGINPAFGGMAGGGFGGLVGTLGLTLNNFSSKKLFKPSLWNPLPSGDGQRLSIRAQSNGMFFQSYSFSFTEPWFGGKKPNSFTFSLNRTIQTFNVTKRDDPNRSFMKITGASLSLGKRLKWPDDYFSVFYSLSYSLYSLQNTNGIFGLLINTGKSNNLEFKYVLSRSSVSEPIFPTSGSTYTLSIAATPPVSLMDKKDYTNLPDKEKFRFIEYHKWKFDAENYTKLLGKFVLATKVRVGLLGYYNNQIGLSPFERFIVGGSGLNSFGQIGAEIISLRGYQDRTLNSNAALFAGQSEGTGAAFFNKFTCELRFPVITSPSATIFLVGFAEAGNAFLNPRTFSLFDNKRSAGAGIRLFLPMFGLIGLDYAYGFDWQTFHPRAGVDKPGQFHFFLGQQF